MQNELDHVALYSHRGTGSKYVCGLGHIRDKSRALETALLRFHFPDQVKELGSDAVQHASARQGRHLAQPTSKEAPPSAPHP
jgi:hypothetical protein